MFNFIKNLFSKKQKVDKDEFDEALENARNRRIDKKCTKYCRHSQMQKPKLTETTYPAITRSVEKTDDTLVEDIVTTVLVNEAVDSLLDSVVDCNDIDCGSSSSSSDWSGDGGGFSGGGASDDW